MSDTGARRCRDTGSVYSRLAGSALAVVALAGCGSTSPQFPFHASTHPYSTHQVVAAFSAAKIRLHLDGRSLTPPFVAFHGGGVVVYVHPTEPFQTGSPGWPGGYFVATFGNLEIAYFSARVAAVSAALARLH